jgi:uncharacterized membrane protein
MAIGLCTARAETPSSAPSKEAHNPAQDVTEPSTLKTLTFLSLASINDFAFGYAFGGLLTGGGMIVANLTTGWLLYYVHEKAWAKTLRFVELPQDNTGIRTGTFTVVNSARIFGLGLLITGKALISSGFVLFNAAGDAVAYAVTDRLWNPIPNPEPPPVRPPRDCASTDCLRVGG